MHDVIIIGGGISAHTAALYTARARLNPLVLSGKDLDQLSTTTGVENFPGFPEGIQGPDLVANARKQAERFGATYQAEIATALKPVEGGYEIATEERTYHARTVIICTGASARRLGIPGEQDYWAKGVATCAPCDAPLFQDKIVVVVGGGDSAMEEALVLTKFAKKVIIVHRRDAFRASKVMQDRVLTTEKIEVMWDTVPVEVRGDTFVTEVRVKNVKSGEEQDLTADGMFLAIGHIPNTKWLDGSGLQRDEKGYIPGVITNLPGVFAGGDVMDVKYMQAVTAAGTGCQAALEAERYLEKQKAEGKY